MSTASLLASNLDLIAFLWFVVAIGLYRLIGGQEPVERRGIVGGIQAMRIQWMRNMADRENRLLDGVVLQALSNGNAFFASTSALAVGGLMTLVGSGDKARAFIERLPFAAPSSEAMWDTKLALLMAIFIYAFFKFAWAFRLSHYAGVMIGATPIANGANAQECDDYALRTAQLIGIAAEHANSGLRSFHYAIAALAWFYHPLFFIAATTWILLVLIRRDFFSRSKRIVTDGNL